MAAKLSLRYDKVGDILYIDRCKPYQEQEAEEIADQVGVRLNPETGEVENLEIVAFYERLAAGESIELPLSGGLRLALEA
jgi:uncharacterized protein YuzE